MSRSRRKFTGKEKVAALRRHLVDGTPVSDICDDLGIAPSHFYMWQKKFFENGEAAFGSHDKTVGKGRRHKDQDKIERLEAKIRRKDEVLSELMEEYVAVKKSLGEN